MIFGTRNSPAGGAGAAGATPAPVASMRRVISIDGGWRAVNYRPLAPSRCVAPVHDQPVAGPLVADKRRTAVRTSPAAGPAPGHQVAGVALPTADRWTGAVVDQLCQCGDLGVGQAGGERGRLLAGIPSLHDYPIAAGALQDEHRPAVVTSSPAVSAATRDRYQLAGVALPATDRPAPAPEWTAKRRSVRQIDHCDQRPGESATGLSRPVVGPGILAGRRPGGGRGG